MELSLYVIGDGRFSTQDPTPGKKDVRSISAKEVDQLYKVYKDHLNIKKRLDSMMKNGLSLKENVIDLTIRLMDITNTATLSIKCPFFLRSLERISITPIQKRSRSISANHQKPYIVIYSDGQTTIELR
jgi:hypothetical protein